MPRVLGTASSRVANRVRLQSRDTHGSVQARCMRPSRARVCTLGPACNVALFFGRQRVLRSELGQNSKIW